MNKVQFSQKLVKWLRGFLEFKFSNTHEMLDVIIPDSNLSKLPNHYIKACPNYSSWEFRPDLVGILKNKLTSEIEFVLLNRTINSLSLKEIGEIFCYSKLVNAKISFLVSMSGCSNELNILLLDGGVRKRLLSYGVDGKIIIFAWDAINDKINENAIIPLENKGYLSSYRFQ